MSKSNVFELSGREETGDALTALLRTGARTLIERAMEAELVEFMARFEGRRLEDGRAAVVRNGYQPERAIETGIGPVTVVASHELGPTFGGSDPTNLDPPLWV
jgi:transposase-like protein